MSDYTFTSPRGCIPREDHHERKQLLGDLLVMVKVGTTPLSVFVGHGCVQQRREEWRKRHSIQYHKYLIPGSRDLPNALAIAYGDSIQVRSRANAVSVKKVGGNRETDVDVEDSEQRSSEGNNEKNSELLDSSLETEDISDD